jgi:ribonucleoside-diphosphate reductase alpha chain
LKLSENALEVLNKRYLKKDSDGNVIETPEEMFRRVAHHIAKTEPDGPEGYAWREKFYEVMSNLEFLPNSPTLRNAGANNGNLSACFVLPIEDSRQSIFNCLRNAVEVQAFGGGTGYNFSRLRQKGSKISSTSGRASGPISFMEVFDFTVGEIIEQSGTRKGAQMGILNCDHPDILQFINCKSEEGKLAHFNISVNYSDEFMKSLEDTDE